MYYFQIVNQKSKATRYDELDRLLNDEYEQTGLIPRIGDTLYYNDGETWLTVDEVHIDAYIGRVIFYVSD